MQGVLFEIQESSCNQKKWFQEMLDSLGIIEGKAWPDKFGKAIHQWLSSNDKKPIKTLSLFSGGGGLDIAFHDCGFDVVQMVEIESKYVETLKANAKNWFPNSDIVQMDIRNYEPQTGMKIDFIIGGPPCQTFSAAGRRAAGVSGTTDPRGTLFEEYVRILRTLQPKGFLFENVYGITGAQNGSAWKEIQAAFKSAGYTIYFRVLDAADYGVPQHRERLFIVGVREGNFLFPYPTHGPDSIGQQPFYAAKEAIRGVDTSGATEGIGGRYGHLLEDVPPGLNYSFYTEEMGHPSPVFSWRSKFSDFLYKADPDSPVRTIKAQGGQYTGPFSWENRRFTIAEFKRLQTFPDDYEVVGGHQVKIEQIGNSVPPQIGRILALSILNQVMDIELPFSMNYLPPNKNLGFRQRKRLLTAFYADKAKAAINRLRVAESPKVFYMKEETRFLSGNFSLTTTAVNESFRIKLRYNITDLLWVITAGSHIDDEALENVYEISISPSNKNEWRFGNGKIRLCALDWSPQVFTSLWKAFEEKLNDIYGIADLVQLSGYYQYIPKISAKLEFHSENNNQPFWRIIQDVVQGIGVGEQVSAQHLSLLWEIEEDEVKSHLKSLRKLGYEVRSHNTNPQIVDGEYLIPYAFPTLTPKSVQLRKKLYYEKT